MTHIIQGDSFITEIILYIGTAIYRHVSYTHDFLKMVIKLTIVRYISYYNCYTFIELKITKLKITIFDLIKRYNLTF